MYSTYPWRFLVTTALVAGVVLCQTFPARAAGVNLLNVSYDPTRELYTDYNKVFTRFWEGKTHIPVQIRQSHGGSGKQTRSIIDGLEADVATLALGYDIDALQDAGLVQPGWEKKLPYNSTPYTSTIVFVVRKGNPKNIHDWSDLARPGVSVITPNPKTSGGARWNYLAAWGYALKQPGGNDATAKAFVSKVYRNVPVLDSGARGSTTTFAQRGIGDVMIAWENEAFLTVNDLGKKGDFQIVNPSVSILAEPQIAIVDKYVDKHHTRDTAFAYVNYLYYPEGQQIIARHHFRPVVPEIFNKYRRIFPKIPMFTVDDTFGGWRKAQKTHFASGGTFDQIYQPR